MTFTIQVPTGSLVGPGCLTLTLRSSRRDGGSEDPPCPIPNRDYARAVGIAIRATLTMLNTNATSISPDADR